MAVSGCMIMDGGNFLFGENRGPNDAPGHPSIEAPFLPCPG
jgi:hypothetical protein